MKKALSLILALLLVACSLPAIITSYAEDSGNLLADATHANGKVTWTTVTDLTKREGNIDAWGGDPQDNKTNSVNGGYSWTFGLGDGRVGGNTFDQTDPTATPWPLYNFEEHKDVYAYVYIKASGLVGGEKYEFSYYYQNDYDMVIDSIKTPGGDLVSFADAAVVKGDKANSYNVVTSFTAPINGEYTIALKTNRYLHIADRDWSNVILSDLVLNKIEGAVNILKNATRANGDVSWTANADAWGTDHQDNKTNSVNGGYSWTFGMGNTSIGLPTNANPAYITIKAKGLTASKRYDFSFIYQGDYNMVLDGIVDSNNDDVVLENEPKDSNILGGNNAHQVVTTFVAPTDGDYTITLMTNRDLHISDRGWSNVILSDLLLIENTNPRKVVAEVLVSGNGGASVSNELPEVGSDVTFTAAPFPDEQFLGWFNGDTKVSDSLVYTVAITEKTTLTAKFTSNVLNVLAGKKASDWTGYRWATVADSSESKNGGHGYLVNETMWQSIYTKVTLEPNTEYDFSFNWKSVVNSVCPSYPVNIKVYAADEVDINDRYNNWSDHGESGLFQPQTGVDLETGENYTTEEIAKTYEWQNLATKFTTTGSTEYYIIIYFSIEGGANHQAVNLSDFFLTTTEKKVPSISDKDASEWGCYEWSSIENTDVSRYGGKGYLVKKAMYQHIFTSLDQLKPNTKYKLSFEWKAVANAMGPVFPNDIYVVAKDDIDVWDTKNPSVWDTGLGFMGGAYDLENGGIMNVVDKAETLEWQNTTVSFTTNEQTDYALVIHFQASGNGEQEIYVSDFKLEEVASDGPPGGDDVPESENLAANYTHSNGHVTWDTVADAWGGEFQDNKASAIYGGFSWSFGLAYSHYDDNPAYVTIKTDDLEANHKYEFSYIYQGDYIPVLNAIEPGVEIVKEEDVKLLEGDRAHRIIVQFTTSQAGPVTIKLKMGKFMNNESCAWSRVILSDLELYDITNRVYGSVKAELGGTATGFDALYCTKGDEITITATPRTGNEFIGWFDENGQLVSDQAVYTFTANADFNLLAKFSGTNIPNADWLEQHGMDGTFENGTMDGWKAEDREWGDDTSWASFLRTSDASYRGEYSLSMRSRYRTTFYQFTDLYKNTDYHLSFYIMHPDLYIKQTDPDQEKTEYNEEALINWFAITGGNGASLYNEKTSYPIKGGSGWYKINYYFNTGDNDVVEWSLNHTDKDGCAIDVIYMDDVSLVEYSADKFANGTFDMGATAWRGEFSVNDGVAQGNNFYQNVNVGIHTLNTVTFKAKGKGIGGASEIIAKEFNSEDYISSESYVNIDSDDWKEYSYTFYSSVNPDVSLFFKAIEGELLVDDITFTKHDKRDGAIVEKVDFETDRFEQKVKSDVFEIYNGTEGDANVHSGSKSLKFNAANAKEGISYVLQEAFVSAQIGGELNYRLTFYYKTTKGNTLLLSPEFLTEENIKTVYTADSNDWTRVDFIFSKLAAGNIKMTVGNVVGKTNADFYVDDITLSIAPPMVIESNSENKYCEWPFNLVENPGFDKTITSNDWGSFPKNVKVISDGTAASGNKHLRIKAGAKYVFPVKVPTSENYYFSISTRLGKDSAGYVGVAMDAKGTQFYGNEVGEVASKIKVDTTKWARDSFLFSVGETDVVYLVFEATKGYIDVDEVHFYKRQYGRTSDPNDHTEFIPYDYENPDPSTIVLNGGDPTFGGLLDAEDLETEQDNSSNDSNDFDGTDDYGDSPDTGDSVALPVALIFVAMLSVVVLFITKDRFQKNSKGGKA